MRFFRVIDRLDLRGYAARSSGTPQRAETV
jgi:hypothetical protein